MGFNNGLMFPNTGMNGFGYPSQGMDRRVTIPRVYGENGARSYQLPPNSETFLLDTTQDIVWLAQSDASGCVMVTPYEFKEHKTAPPVDMQALEERLKRIEEALYGSKSDPVKADRPGGREQQPSE